MKEFYNEELENVVNIAKDNNLQVWTFESGDKYIKQVFITDDKNIGTCCAQYSGVRFGTVHKPNSVSGTGYGLQDDHIINATIEDIKESFIHCPKWGKSGSVKKYEDWNEYLNRNTTLKYYQL